MSWGSDDRGVRAMRGTERVVDEGIDTADELGDEPRIVGGLTGAEPDVLEQFDPRGEFREPLTDRGEGERRIGTPLRPPEMTRADHARPTRGEPLDGRQSRPDTEVVDDRRLLTRAVERDIEVAPHEHTTAGDITEIVETGDPVGGHRQRATCLTRSTRRFE